MKKGKYVKGIGLIPRSPAGLPSLPESLAKAEASQGGHEVIKALKQKCEVREIVCPKCGAHCEIPETRTFAVTLVENAATFMSANIVAQAIEKGVARLARPGTVEWCKSVLEKNGYKVDKAEKK